MAESNTPSVLPPGGTHRVAEQHQVQHYYDLLCEAIRRGEKLEMALREISDRRLQSIKSNAVAEYAEVCEIARRALL